MSFLFLSPSQVESDEKDNTKDKPQDEIIDMDTFQQILDLDEEDDDREFSRGMVEAYFDQASQTFEDMDIALYAAINNFEVVS